LQLALRVKIVPPGLDLSPRYRCLPVLDHCRTSVELAAGDAFEDGQATVADTQHMDWGARKSAAFGGPGEAVVLQGFDELRDSIGAKRHQEVRRRIGRGLPF
jgi:hypothetical protein